MYEAMASSEAIVITLKNNSIIQLKAKEQSRELSGTSKKEIYQDQAGTDYYLKEAKPRKIEAIFHHDLFFKELRSHRREFLGDAVFNSYTEKPEDEATLSQIQMLSGVDSTIFAKLQEDIEKYVEHVQELMLINTALEILASHISAKIMGDLLISPHNYFYRHNNTPTVLSRSVGNLREFLSEHPLLAMAKTPDHWENHSAPFFAELRLSEGEARILGQAYFVALLFGHNDLVNNINLSNLGYILMEDGSLKLSIVDWGNALGVGFGGLTAEEGAFINSQFGEQSGIDRFKYQSTDRTGFKHIMPFDEIVYPLLPRQVVLDLFDLTKDDAPALRQAQREGFYEACERAVMSSGKMQELIDTTVKDTLQNSMSLDDAMLINRLLPEFICSTNITEKHKNNYNLATILEGRIKSLQKMKNALEDGRSLTEIAQETFGFIQKSQDYSAVRFFPQKKPASVVTCQAQAIVPYYDRGCSLISRKNDGFV